MDKIRQVNSRNEIDRNINKTEKTFEEWFKELKNIGIGIYGPEGFDLESWKQYYDDGYTPKDALNEDLSYG